MKHTIFCDQGETCGGAERFLIDFLASCSPSEIHRLNPIIVGAKSAEYKKLLPENIKVIDFDFPSVGGGVFKKMKAIWRLFIAAKKFKNLISEFEVKNIFTNTPRTHFVVFLSRKFFFCGGKWTAFFHDFTTRPVILLRAICRSANVLVVNSLPTRKFLRERISKKSFYKIQIVENGIDFQKIPSQAPPDKLQNFLILGRIDPRKGQIFAIKAAIILRDEFPKIKFKIVGSPFKEDQRTMKYASKIRILAQEKKCENIEFISEVKDPFQEIIKADAVLVLSTEAETFGRVVIEALACSRLVLAFNETGPREILQNFEQFCLKKTGQKSLPSVRIEKQSVENLVEKIKFFMQNFEQTKVFTNNAREFVKQAFALETTKKRLLNLLLEK
jgi:glycosyltransferase involved in cell wall biosynthesis